MRKKIQKIESKKGEVFYRSKLILQYQGKETCFPNEPNKLEIINTLKQRINSTKKDFNWLKKHYQVNFSPYLEIGAEFGHRAAFLEEKYHASGFALDISLESLSQADFFAKNLKLKKIPKRICADAYNLPFGENSFNFIFCYQTLHHFPNPRPIIKEIYRVLRPGGYLFVNEEPVKQLFNLRLWRRPTKLRTWEKILKYLLILPFVSTIGKTETEHQILEREFNLDTWQKGFGSFENLTIWLKPYPFGKEYTFFKNSQGNWLKPSPKNRFLISILGAGLKAVGRKEGRISSKEILSVDQLLACPSCLIPLNQKLFCLKCQIQYLVKKNIKILMPKKISSKLYPTS